MEGLKKSGAGQEDQKIVRHTLKEAMRFPTTAHKILQSSETLAFLRYYKDTTLANTSPVPEFVAGVINTIESTAGGLFSYALRAVTRK